MDSGTRFGKVTLRIGAGIVVMALSGGLGTTAAYAGDTISDLVAQISEASYTHYLYDVMYTHLGDDRGYGPEHDLARDNVEDLFEGFGLTTSLHPFEYRGTIYYNVVGVHEGTVRPDEIYIVGAHYDSVNNPGADDNASGVSCVLETARVLSQYDFEATLIFIAFDREEQGLHGSDAYAYEHRNDDIRGMISTDMIAYNPGDLRAYLFGRTQSAVLKQKLADAIAAHSNGITATIGGTADFSDHAPFEWQGFQATCLIEYNYSSNPHYHRSSDSVDTPNYIDYEFATNMARGVLGYLATEAVLIDLVLSDPVPGQAGMSNDLRVSGATPGEVTYFVYGFEVGQTSIPPCPGATVGISNPVIAGKATADAGGEATLTRFVHRSAGGKTLLLQAVEPSSCLVSNAVSFDFP